MAFISDAGPSAPAPKEELLHPAECGSRALQLFRHGAPCDVVHATFFSSTLAAIEQRAGAITA